MTILEYMVSVIRDSSHSNCLAFPEELQYMNEVSKMPLEAITHDAVDLRREVELTYQFIAALKPKAHACSNFVRIVDFLGKAIRQSDELYK